MAWFLGLPYGVIEQYSSRPAKKAKPRFSRKQRKKAAKLRKLYGSLATGVK